MMIRPVLAGLFAFARSPWPGDSRPVVTEVVTGHGRESVSALFALTSDFSIQLREADQPRQHNHSD